MVGIYKIENLIDHKVYIGQSVCIERRWGEHCRGSKKSIISSAIQKYGKENFSFTILEECKVEELNNREEYYIRQFNSVVPNGYNIMEWHNGSQIQYVLDKEILNEIVSKIKNPNILFSEIAEEYNVCIRTITRINQGQTYHQDNIDYPIRKRIVLEDAFCKDCGKPIYKGSIRCKACADLAQRTVERPSKEELLSFLTIHRGNFTAAGRTYGVSDNAVRKWCRQYGLPSKSSEYK